MIENNGVFAGDVVPHVWLDGEALAAVRTNERLLASVSTNVVPDVGEHAGPVSARSAKEDMEKSRVGGVGAAPDAASWVPACHRLFWGVISK